MQRKTIYTLSFLMVFSLFGVLGLQGFWLKQAIDQSRAEFDQRANRALIASAQALGRLNIEKRLEDELEKVTITRKPLSMLDSLPKLANGKAEMLRLKADSFYRAAKGITINSVHSDLDSIERYIKLREGSYVVVSPTIESEQKVFFRNKLHEEIEILEQAVQTVFIRRAAGDLNIEDLLADRNVGAVMKENLKAEGIDLDFEFIVKTDSVLSMYSSTENTALTPYVTSLFPESGIEADLYLGFATKGSYVLKNTWEVLVLVAIFSLMIIGTTAFAIRYMLKQKRLADMKTDFINNMTHEFKTPLATISLAADSIRHPNIFGRKEEIDRFSTIISKESKRLNYHVENILQLAKMDRGELQLNRKEQNLAELIDDLLQDNSLMLKQTNARVNLKIPNRDLMVLVDPFHFRNALMNLIDNSVKYADGQPIIEIEVKQEGQKAEIVFGDQGRGMSDEARRRAFESFYREQTGNLHEVKGFGVGLSYVKKIVEAHGANIDLWSKPGKGTLVTIQMALI